MFIIINETKYDVSSFVEGKIYNRDALLSSIDELALCNECFPDWIFVSIETITAEVKRGFLQMKIKANLNLEAESRYIEEGEELEPEDEVIKFFAIKNS